jgi:hypothetical protein
MFHYKIKGVRRRAWELGKKNHKKLFLMKNHLLRNSFKRKYCGEGPTWGAWTKPILRWKLQSLKDMDINAIRPSHNFIPPMFYESCDEVGLLVKDEIFDVWHKKVQEEGRDIYYFSNSNDKLIETEVNFKRKATSYSRKST